MFTLLCCPWIGLYQARKLFRSWDNGPIWSIDQPMNQCGSKEDRQVIWQQTPINRISPICFHITVNRLESGKDDSSSEAHLQSSKTSRSFYLGLYIFFKPLNSISWPSPFKVQCLSYLPNTPEIFILTSIVYILYCTQNSSRTNNMSHLQCSKYFRS